MLAHGSRWKSSQYSRIPRIDVIEDSPSIFRAVQECKSHHGSALRRDGHYGRSDNPITTWGLGMASFWRERGKWGSAHGPRWPFLSQQTPLPWRCCSQLNQEAELLPLASCLPSGPTLRFQLHRPLKPSMAYSRLIGLGASGYRAGLGPKSSPRCVFREPRRFIKRDSDETIGLNPFDSVAFVYTHPRAQHSQ